MERPKDIPKGLSFEQAWGAAGESGDGASRGVPVPGPEPTPAPVPEAPVRPQDEREPVGVSEEALDLIRAVLAEQARLAARLEEVYDAVRPVLMSANHLAVWADTSERTIYNRVKDGTLPVRDVHGRPWEEGAGPKRYALREWEACQALSTRSIRNELRRRQAQKAAVLGRAQEAHRSMSQQEE